MHHTFLYMSFPFLHDYDVKMSNFAFLGDVTRDDSQRRFSAQHSLAMLEQCCKHSKQCRNNAVVLFCTEKKKIKSIPCLRQKSRKTYPGWPHVLIKPL